MEGRDVREVLRFVLIDLVVMQHRLPTVWQVIDQAQRGVNLVHMIRVQTALRLPRPRLRLALGIQQLSTHQGVQAAVADRVVTPIHA